MVSLVKSDVVAPVDSADAIALAIEQRVRHADNPTPFTPTVVGTFTHGTTAVGTVIGATIGSTTLFSSATAMTSGALVTACSTLTDQVNENRLLINRIAYILEANGMTS